MDTKDKALREEHVQTDKAFRGSIHVYPHKQIKPSGRSMHTGKALREHVYPHKQIKPQGGACTPTQTGKALRKEHAHPHKQARPSGSMCTHTNR
jgi:hypothetical protein